MNKEQTKQAIAVMQGFVDGKTIQYSPHDNGRWTECAASPLWEWNNSTYRIKPEVVKTRRYLYGADETTIVVGITSVEWRVSEIETHSFFIRWIDTEWQEIEV